MNTETETKTEVLSVQIHLMSQATDVALDLETNDSFAAEEKLFSISEELAHLKVLVGTNDPRYKKLESINNSLKSRVDIEKRKTSDFV